MNFHFIDRPSKLPVILALAFVSLISLGKIGGAVYDYEIAMIDRNTEAPAPPPHLPQPFRHEPHVQTAQPHEDQTGCYGDGDPCRQRQVDFI